MTLVKEREVSTCPMSNPVIPLFNSGASHYLGPAWGPPSRRGRTTPATPGDTPRQPSRPITIPLPTCRLSSSSLRVVTQLASLHCPPKGRTPRFASILHLTSHSHSHTHTHTARATDGNDPTYLGQRQEGVVYKDTVSATGDPIVLRRYWCKASYAAFGAHQNDYRPYLGQCEQRVTVVVVDLSRLLRDVVLPGAAPKQSTHGV
jgi:hypothetical protein